MSVWDGNMDVWSWCGHLVRMTSGFYFYVENTSETQGLVGLMSSDLCRTTVMRWWFPKRPCTALKNMPYSFITSFLVDVWELALKMFDWQLLIEHSQTLYCLRPCSCHTMVVKSCASEVSINAVFFCLKNAQTRLDNVRLSLFHN